MTIQGDELWGGVLEEGACQERLALELILMGLHV